MLRIASTSILRTALALALVTLVTLVLVGRVTPPADEAAQAATNQPGSNPRPHGRPSAVTPRWIVLFEATHRQAAVVSASIPSRASNIIDYPGETAEAYALSPAVMDTHATQPRSQHPRSGMGNA